MLLTGWPGVPKLRPLSCEDITWKELKYPVRNLTELKIENADNTGDPDTVARNATDNLQQREEISRMLRAMDDLPPDQKEVIMLGIFQDLSYAQMEEITGTKAVTLRSRMFHGLKKLAGMISGGRPFPEVAQQLLAARGSLDSLLVRLVLQNKGTLARNKRELFTELRDDEVAAIESAVRSAMGSTEIPSDL